MSASPKKITSKIVGYALADKAAAVTEQAAPAAAIEVPADAKPNAAIIPFSEAVSRPDVLKGTTYKLKSPTNDSAMYITINDYMVNEGTEDEHYRPFEMFINSKNMEHFQWVTAITLLISAVFRKGGDIAFLVAELKSVHDPKGGYFKKGGVYVPSSVAEIGIVLEDHLQAIGLLKKAGLDEHQQKLVKEKREQFNAAQAKTAAPEATSEEESYPASSTVCTACHTKAVIKLDGCDVCLACSASKCG